MLNVMLIISSQARCAAGKSIIFQSCQTPMIFCQIFSDSNQPYTGCAAMLCALGTVCRMINGQAICVAGNSILYQTCQTPGNISSDFLSFHTVFRINHLCNNQPPSVVDRIIHLSPRRYMQTSANRWITTKTLQHGYLSTVYLRSWCVHVLAVYGA